MAWAAVAGAAIGVVGGALNSSSARSAAKGQSQAAADAQSLAYGAQKDQMALQQKQYEQSRADLEPWRNSGSAALSKLSGLLGLDAGLVDKEKYRTGTDKKLVHVTADNLDEQGLFEANPVIAQDAGRVGYSARTFMDNFGWPTWVMQYESTPTYDEDAYNKAIEAAKQDPSYGSLLKNFTAADFQEDPGFQFRLQEGEKAINRALASRGQYDSGAAMKELTAYNSGQASQEFNNAYNRDATNKNRVANFLQSVAGLGQSAANTTASAGSSAASNMSNALASGSSAIGNYMTQAANANASGIVGGGNALSGGLSGAFNAYQSNQLMNKLFSGGANAADPAAASSWGGSYAGFNNPSNYG